MLLTDADARASAAQNGIADLDAWTTLEVMMLTTLEGLNVDDYALRGLTRTAWTSLWPRGRRRDSPCCGDWPPNYGCASRLSKTLPLSGTGRLTDCLALLAPVACQTRHSTLAAKLVMRLSMSDH
jgi:hypothetical protein